MRLETMVAATPSDDRASAFAWEEQSRSPAAALLLSMQSNSPTALSWIGAHGLFDLGSANGERRSEPPRREDRRYPPLSELGEQQRREFHEALLEAGGFEDLPGRWQAAILEAEQNRPKLGVVSGGSG